MVKPGVETEVPSEISTRPSGVFHTSVVFSGFIISIITIIWNCNWQLVFKNHMAEPHRTVSVDNSYLRWERKPYKILVMNRSTDQAEDMLGDFGWSHLFSDGSMFSLHRKSVRVTVLTLPAASPLSTTGMSEPIRDFMTRSWHETMEYTAPPFLLNFGRQPPAGVTVL